MFADADLLPQTKPLLAPKIPGSCSAMALASKGFRNRFHAKNNFFSGFLLLLDGMARIRAFLSVPGWMAHRPKTKTPRRPLRCPGFGLWDIFQLDPPKWRDVHFADLETTRSSLF